eukprot:6492403-Amphidinium_carterae.5
MLAASPVEGGLDFVLGEPDVDDMRRNTEVAKWTLLRHREVVAAEPDVQSAFEAHADDHEVATTKAFLQVKPFVCCMQGERVVQVAC